MHPFYTKLAPENRFVARENSWIPVPRTANGQIARTVYELFEQEITESRFSLC